MGFYWKVELLWEANSSMIRKVVRLTESDLYRIVKESVKRLIESDGPNLEKWYRGYNSEYGSQKDHLLWVTSDVGYAAEYGDVVEELVIDDNKLHCVSIYDIEEITGKEYDYYEGPSKDDVIKLLANGYNAHEFEANHGMSDCLCLFDLSMVVGRRVLSSEELDSLLSEDV